MLNVLEKLSFPSSEQKFITTYKTTVSEPRIKSTKIGKILIQMLVHSSTSIALYFSFVENIIIPMIFQEMSESVKYDKKITQE